MKIILTPASLFDLEAQPWLVSANLNGKSYNLAQLKEQGIDLTSVSSREEVSQRLLALYQLADKLDIPLIQAREILPLESYLTNCLSKAKAIESKLYLEPISETQQAKQAYFSDLFKLLNSAHGLAWKESSFTDGKIRNSFLAYKAEKFWQTNDSQEIAELLSLSDAEFNQLESRKASNLTPSPQASECKEQILQKYLSWLTEQELAKSVKNSKNQKTRTANSKIPYNWRVRKDEWILFLDEQAIYAPDLEKKLLEIQKLTLNAEVLVISDQTLDQTCTESLAQLGLQPNCQETPVSKTESEHPHELAAELFNARLNQIPLQQEVADLNSAEQDLLWGKEMKREFDYKFNLHRKQKGTGSAFFVRLLDSGNGISGFMMRASAIKKVVDFLPETNSLANPNTANNAELRLANDLWLLPKSSILEVAYLRGAWVRGFSEATPTRDLSAWQQKRDIIGNWGLKLKAYLRMLKLVAGIDD